MDTAQGAAELMAGWIETLGQARVYNLAQPMEHTMPSNPSGAPFRMALTWRHGDRVWPSGGSGAIELMSMSGHTGTHVDALCHISVEGKLHGGVDAAAAQVGGRLRAHGAERIAPLICRGVLLDLAGLEGAESLEPERAITAEDLERCSREHGVEIRAGDAVLLRTGWPTDRWNDERAYVGFGTGVPGPDLSAARHLSERRVRLTGSDTIAYEQIVRGHGHTRLPVHEHLLVEAGIHIVEVLRLDELAAAGVHEFLFVMVPLRLVGATGSPVTPLAIVPVDD
jgi:kynurenine formamidase